MWALIISVSTTSSNLFYCLYVIFFTKFLITPKQNGLSKSCYCLSSGAKSNYWDLFWAFFNNSIDISFSKRFKLFQYLVQTLKLIMILPFFWRYSWTFPARSLNDAFTCFHLLCAAACWPFFLSIRHLSLHIHHTLKPPSLPIIHHGSVFFSNVQDFAFIVLRRQRHWPLTLGKCCENHFVILFDFCDLCVFFVTIQFIYYM